MHLPCRDAKVFELDNVFANDLGAVSILRFGQGFGEELAQQRDTVVIPVMLLLPIVMKVLPILFGL